MQDLTDEDLMGHVQNGNPAAYRVLFDRHQQRIYGFLLRRTRDPQITAELYQETFLKLHRARHTWRPGHSFRSWLFGIAANTAKDHHRYMQRRPEQVPFEEWTAHQSDHPTTRLQLERAIGALPDNLRTAFLLGVVEGFNHREVAEQLEISPANARARISRARAQLRTLLQNAESSP